jgi:sulfate transport system ATP-binding protein
MDFLGNVNVFHARVQNGKARVGAMEFEYPEYSGSTERAAKCYVRPHELEILSCPNGAPSLKARIERINSTGSVAKLSLVSEDFGVGVQVDLSPDRFAQLQLKQGDTVYVSPRRARVFVPEYVI